MTPSILPSRNQPRLRLARGVSRRDVLRYAVGSAGIAALGPVLGKRLPIASGAPLGNKVLVIIDLDGGCDTLNAVIPSNLSNYFSRRTNIAIQNNLSLALTGGPGNSSYRLHPSLDTYRDLWNAGDVALINRVGYPSENLSHFESQDIYSFGVRGSFAPLGVSQSGWIARYAEHYAPTPMGAVSIGMGRPRAFIGGTSNPLQVGSLSSFRFSTDNAFAQNDAYRTQVIKNVLAGATTVGTPGEVRSAIDQAETLASQIQTALSAYNTNLAAASPAIVYPANSGIASQLKDVAALLYGGFETRIFYLGLGGHDTHGDQGTDVGTQATLFARLDDAMKAFSDDMKRLGQWDNVVVATYTEFGRRNYENGSKGTDHGAAFAMTLAGGAVNGGVYGPDLTTTDLGAEYVTYAVDFRDVYKEILNDHLNATPAPVFPETQPSNVVLGLV